jgi:cytochrome c biogenesis protein CcdA
MLTLAVIGFLGGLITGISPCILPVLPVIFFSGAQTGRPRPDADIGAAGGTATATETRRSVSETLRPLRVIAGLVLSFSVVTLAGSALLSLLHLPQDALRWIGIVALTVIGVGLIFPRVEELLEKPFARIPQFNASEGRSGFGLGLALGVLFVRSCSRWPSPSAPRSHCWSSRSPDSASPNGSGRSAAINAGSGSSEAW